MDDHGLRRHSSLLVLFGVIDVVIGLSLIVAGRTQDIDAVVIGGVALTLAGAGIAAAITLVNNRPEQL